MKTLSESTFKTLAGDGAYERGLAYYNQGHVGELRIKKNHISAEVEGTHTYQVELQHTAKLFEGSCNCPASDNFDFCKHCVAVALTYYYQTQTNQELAESDQGDRLLSYMDTLTKPQLIDSLYKLVQQDSETLDYWRLKSEIASGSLGGPEIRKRITKAIPYRPSGLWRYREVEQYFQQSEQALSLLEEPLLTLKPTASVKLLVYVLQRLEKTLESVDDSGGYRDGVETIIMTWFTAIFSSDQWSSKQKADCIIKLIFDDGFSYDLLNLPIGAAAYIDDKELNGIYTHIEKQWNTLSPDNEAYSEAFYHYQRLERLLLGFARSQKNLEHEFRILERGAVNVDRCLALVELCVANTLLTDAEKWLSYATQITQPSIRELYEIETAQIDIYKAQKKYRKALDIQWARFEEQESHEQFNEALKTAAKIQQKEKWLNKGIETIKAKLVPRDTGQKNRQRAELVTHIYLANNLINDAIDMSKRYLLKPPTMMAIVRASVEIDSKTFRLIETAVNRLVFTANNYIYDEAITFLKQQFKRLNVEHSKEFKTLVLRIYNEPSNKRKINFVNRLKSAFPDYF